MNRIRSEYSFISKILIAGINSFLIYRTNSTLGEFVLNFIKIDSNEGNVISDKSNGYKVLYLICIEYIIPLFIELIPKVLIYLKNFTWTSSTSSRIINNKLSRFFKQFINSIRLLRIFIDLAYKLKYIFDKDFLYFDSLSHLLRIMVVNKGSKGVLSEKFLNVGRQLNLFFLFMFIRLGEWYYKKEIKNEEGSIEIDAPQKIEGIANSKCPLCKNRLEKDLIAVKCCGCVYCDGCVKRLMQESKKCYTCGNLMDEKNLVKIFN